MQGQGFGTTGAQAETAGREGAGGCLARGLAGEGLAGAGLAAREGAARAGAGLAGEGLAGAGDEACRKCAAAGSRLCGRQRAVAGYRKDQMVDAPFNHYVPIYRGLDPGEAGARCGVPFNAGRSAFLLRLMGTRYEVAFPGFDMRAAPEDAAAAPPLKYQDRLLVLRYLCEGRHAPWGGRQVAYDELPWGNVYFANFRNRCIRRAARALGSDIAAFEAVMGRGGALRAERLPHGDAGYRFEFIDGLFMSIILWAGDDEFPASAQILFDDNFEHAFTAEDVAAVGEVAIDKIKAAQGRRRADGRA